MVLTAARLAELPGLTQKHGPASTQSIEHSTWNGFLG
jgi:hypothetical protein